MNGRAGADANVIFGVAFDPNLEDEMRVTVIATGFDSAPKSMQNTIESQIEKAAQAAAAKAAGNTAAEEAPKKEQGDELISDDDFDELLGILHKNNGNH